MAQTSPRCIGIFSPRQGSRRACLQACSLCKRVAQLRLEAALRLIACRSCSRRCCLRRLKLGRRRLQLLTQQQRMSKLMFIVGAEQLNEFVSAVGFKFTLLRLHYRHNSHAVQFHSGLLGRSSNASSRPRAHAIACGPLHLVQLNQNQRNRTQRKTGTGQRTAQQ